MTKLSKNIFYVTKNETSHKFIVKANINNGLFADNSTIAHFSIRKNGFCVYLHERADILTDERAKHNDAYDKRENEKFSRKFDYAINFDDCNTDKKRESAYKNAVKTLLNEFETNAQTLRDELTKENEPA